MYIRQNATVKAPFDVCRYALLAPADSWLPHIVRELEEPHGELLARLGFSVLGIGVTKQVALQLGDAELRRDWLRIPIHWEARPASDAFPVFEGEIQLAPADAASTKLEVSGTYDPPLGRVGSSADNLVMNQAARATVRRFVREVAAHLRRQAAAGDGTR